MKDHIEEFKEEEFEDMTITLHTEGWFDAAHHLENYEGACKNLHGHTYLCEVWVRGKQSQLQPNGILWDFGNLKKILSEWDHAGDLTDKLGCNSTAENQVVYIYNRLKTENKKLRFKVRIYEQIEPKKSWSEMGDWE